MLGLVFISVLLLSPFCWAAWFSAALVDSLSFSLPDVLHWNLDRVHSAVSIFTGIGLLVVLVISSSLTMETNTFSRTILRLYTTESLRLIT